MPEYGNVYNICSQNIFLPSEFVDIEAAKICLCDIIPIDAFDHGNESAINKCRLDFKRFCNKAQLNNLPSDGYKCVHFAISASSPRQTPLRSQV